MNHLTRLEDRMFGDHITLYRSSRSVTPGRVRSIGIAMEPTTDPAPTAQRRVRSDATRNQAAIVAAATTTCAETGHAVDVRKIAERAGVGTLYRYRHFPTKHDLLDTVLHEQFRSWAHTAALY